MAACFKIKKMIHLEVILLNESAPKVNLWTLWLNDALPPTQKHTHPLLTAVVVVTTWQKLKPQREGGEPLDLFGEAHRPKRSVGGVTLPPLDGPSGLHAALERGLSHQVEGQRLRLPGALAPLVGVVRAVNVQVVIQIRLDGQISFC